MGPRRANRRLPGAAAGLLLLLLSKAAHRHRTSNTAEPQLLACKSRSNHECYHTSSCNLMLCAHPLAAAAADDAALPLLFCAGRGVCELHSVSQDPDCLSGLGHWHRVCKDGECGWPCLTLAQ